MKDLRARFDPSYDCCLSMAATLSATGFSAIRQHGGNSYGFPASQASAASSAYHACNLLPKVLPKTEVHAMHECRFGLPEPYRYGDSNPGFRTENPAS